MAKPPGVQGNLELLEPKAGLRFFIILNLRTSTKISATSLNIASNHLAVENDQYRLILPDFPFFILVETSYINTSI